MQVECKQFESFKNFTCKPKEWDWQVNKKISNPIENWEQKPIFQRKALLNNNPNNTGLG